MSPALWVGGGVALAAAAVIGFQQVQIGGLRDRVVELERAKAAETQARTQWQEQAQACSSATATLKAQGERARRAYQDSLQRAAGATAAAQAQVRAILSEARPEGLDECQAARAELDAEVDRRRGP